MRVKRVSARYRGKITRSLNELWYFVGMTLEPMDLDQRRVVNGVACSMTSRGCRVKPLQLGHSLILSWPQAINGPRSSFHVFHAFSRENVFRQRARCTREHNLQPHDFLSLPFSATGNLAPLLVEASSLESSVIGHSFFKKRRTKEEERINRGIRQKGKWK